jgi:hypothetical protein
MASRSPLDIPAKLFEVAIGQNRMGKLEGVAVLGSLLQDVALGSDVADERHHHLFPNGIDRWIGNLSEQLFEVVE